MNKSVPVASLIRGIAKGVSPRSDRNSMARLSRACIHVKASNQYALWSPISLPPAAHLVKQFLSLAETFSLCQDRRSFTEVQRMRALGNQLIADDGTVLAEFSRHWYAVTALLARNEPTINETQWPFRPEDISGPDLAVIKQLRLEGKI